jgi:hypothetical protein
VSHSPVTGSPERGGIRDFLEAHGYFLRHAIAITLIAGIYLHLTALFIGRELLMRHILTPTFEVFLAIPMTYAGVMGLVLWRRVEHPAPWHAVLYGFIVVYFLISIPLHIQTLVTQSTAYILVFPSWYSYLAVAMQLGLLAFANTIRLRPA